MYKGKRKDIPLPLIIIIIIINNNEAIHNLNYH